MAASSPISILVVDDNPIMVSLLHDFLTRQGFLIRTANSSHTALHALSTQRPRAHLIVSDVEMGETNGIELSRVLSTQCPEIPVILYSVKKDWERDSLAAGAQHFLPAPFSLSFLLRAIEDCL